MARSNGELIAQARRMTEEVGRRPATVARGARDAGDQPRERRGRRVVMSLPLEGIRVLDLSRLLAGRLLLAAARRLRRGRAEGRGHRHGRLHPLVPALRRGRGGQRQVRAVPGAQPQQALDPPGPQARAGPRGAAGARARARRRARVLPPGRARPPRRRLRAHARGQPRDRLLRDLRLRPDRAQARRRRARHELPRPRRPARAHRRGRRRWVGVRCSPPARSPTSAAAR